MRLVAIDEAPEIPVEYLPAAASPVGELVRPHTGPVDACMLSDARRAAEAHRRSRYCIQRQIRPGMSLDAIVDIVEGCTRVQLAGEKNDGIGFPTGVSMNSCAAHHTTNPGDPEVLLREDDVLKIDFGTQVNGWIMDSAFTVCFDPRYEQLLRASKEATEMGIKCLGVDVRVCDIGAEIEEVIKSYELVVGDSTCPIKPVENLNGHSIDQYQIHAGITIPAVRNRDKTRIRPGCLYAVETFATTGRGYVGDGNGCSHYILDRHVKKHVPCAKARKVLNTIVNSMGTLPFCPRYIDRVVPNSTGSRLYIEKLARMCILDSYPPLVDNSGSLVAQFEHTVFLSDTGKEVLTRGDDY